MTCGAVAVAVAARARRRSGRVWPGCFEAVCQLRRLGAAAGRSGRAAARPLGLPDAQGPVRAWRRCVAYMLGVDLEFVIGYQMPNSR